MSGHEGKHAYPKVRTAHQKVMRAARRGVGCRLSADDTMDLAFDQAIIDVASSDDGWENE